MPSYTVFESAMIGASDPVTSISRDSFGRLVATSGSKLLVFDGSYWSSYQQASEVGKDPVFLYSTITGLDDRVYCTSEEGLHRVEFMGNQQYALRSIVSPGIDLSSGSYAAIRHSFNRGEDVYFFGTERTVRYSTETGLIGFDFIDRHSTSSLLPFQDVIIEYGTSEYLYSHNNDGSIDKIDMNRSHLPRQETRVATVWRDSVYLGHDTGLSVFRGGVIEPWRSEIGSLRSQSISDMVPLSDDYMAVAVKSQGIFILDTDGRIVQSLDRQIDHRFGRADNLHYAGNGVILASLDMSLVRVDFLSPLSDFSSPLPYATQYPKILFHNHTLHLMTDGKLLEAEYYSGGGLRQFRNLLPDLENKVETAVSTEEGIVFSDYKGVYILKSDGAIERLGDHLEVKMIAKMKTNPPALILAGKSSIKLLENINGRWTFTGQSLPAPGRSYYSVSMENGSVWLEHGMGKISRSNLLGGKLSIRSFGVEDGLNRSWNNIWSYQDSVYVTSGEDFGVLYWNEELDRLEKLPEGSLSPIQGIKEPTRPGEDTLGNLWVPTVLSAHAVLRKSSKGEVVVDTKTLADLRGEQLIKVVAGNSGSMWLIGRDKLFRYDPRLVKDDLKLSPTRIYQIEQIDDHAVVFDSRGVAGNSGIVIPYRNNSLRIYLTNPNVGYTNIVSHQYRVNGRQEVWSTLATPNFLLLPNLIEGSYELMVRPTYDGINFGNVSSISFRVAPPIYRTLWAYCGYVVIFGTSILVLFHFIRVRAEARNRELQRLVKERTRGLDQANWHLTEMYEKVKAADQAKGTFLATVSHEMRTPLNAIIGPSQLLLVEEQRKKQGDFLRMINNAGVQLLKFIDDVLEFTSTGNQDRPLVTEVFDLRELIGDLAGSIEVQAKGKELDFLFNIDSGVSRFWIGDASLIKQIIGNVLNNALKFTESGTVSLTVKTDRSELNEPRMVVEVSDTGIGIPEAARSMIYEPFQQVENAYTRHFEGAGLGLSICRQLVARMGGTINYESTLGKGTTFWIRIPINPVSDNEVELENDEGGLPEIKLPLKRILIVDDNESNRIFASHALRGMDCSVELALNGKQAVKMAGTAKFDLILMDIRMPIMNGIDASSRIRSTCNPNRKTPIVALSAYLSKEQEQECEKMGINRCLSKPIIASQLNKAVIEEFDAATEG